MTPEATVHRTETGHLPEARAVSWGCTCGAAEVIEYGPSFPMWAAIKVARKRGKRHEAEAVVS